MPLLHAVTLAGGFVESRATGKVKLLRPNPESGDALVIETDIDKLLGGAHQEVLVLAGDTIVVTQDNFYVYGEVARPGMYPLESGKTVLTAVSMAGGLTKFGAPTKVKVLTKNEQTKAFDTIKVNLNDVISGDSAADIKLKSGDIIVISESAF
jgi:polysaccharide export outer membrane protein